MSKPGCKKNDKDVFAKEIYQKFLDIKKDVNGDPLIEDARKRPGSL